MPLRSHLSHPAHSPPASPGDGAHSLRASVTPAVCEVMLGRPAGPPSSDGSIIVARTGTLLFALLWSKEGQQEY
ncbi:hypothetical protein E2C01_037793 [Portunus trituberculatus]|uniref:Uncharacterized protein n=1 Tax=Portunus trituberculatus TaxID=210409 RepID=A0A5B7FFX0_PORTR|nr:hypothetical protein [Portunus trituberculatus]